MSKKLTKDEIEEIKESFSPDDVPRLLSHIEAIEIENRELKELLFIRQRSIKIVTPKKNEY